MALGSAYCNRRAALIIYDALLTAEAERKFVWSRKLDLTLAIFAMNRLTIIMMIVTTLLTSYASGFEVRLSVREPEGVSYH